MEQFFVYNTPLIIAILSVIIAVFQWRKSVNETNNFRQQLVSILHHAEGINDNIRNLVFPDNLPNNITRNFATVDDVQKAANGILQDSQALVLGLLELRIAGKPIKNNLDKKYNSIADNLLEMKLIPGNSVINTSGTPRTTFPENNLLKVLYNKLLDKIR